MNKTDLKKEKLKEFDTKLKELQDLTQELLDKKENGESRIVEFGLKEIDDDNIHTIPDWGNIRKFLEDAIDQTRKEVLEEVEREVIGDDEFDPDKRFLPRTYEVANTRNIFRKIQRDKLKKLDTNTLEETLEVVDKIEKKMLCPANIHPNNVNCECSG